MQHRALSLSDHQLRVLKDHARAIPPRQRERWLEAVTKNLVGEVSDHALMASINVEMNRLPVYTCDDKK